MRVRCAILLSVCFATHLGSVGRALAQEEDACSAVTGELKGVQRALEQARSELAQAAGVAAELVIVRQALSTIERELARAKTEHLACEERHDALCQGTRSFTHSLSIGKVDTSSAAACIDPGDRRAIVEQLAGWTNVSKALARLEAYSSGESDIPPGLGPRSGARVEAIMAQILGSGGATPVVFRRLVIEALLLLAPDAWAKRQRQAGQATRFFTDRGDLPEDIRTEVTAAASTGRADSGDTSLTVALELLRAYQLLAGCGGATAAADCRRAEQLADLVQTSGTLVAMRRVGSIWHTECESVNSEVLSSWITDFPGLRSEDQDFQAVLSAVHYKLTTCFLRDPGASKSLKSWVSKKMAPLDLPAPEEKKTLAALTDGFGPGTSGERCVLAVRSLQNMSPPARCSASPEFIGSLHAWAGDTEQNTSFALSVCDRYARSLFRGQTATIATSFDRAPGVDEALRIIEDAPPSSMSQLREQCSSRASGADFVRSVTGLAAIAQNLGENPRWEPWLVDLEQGVPLEDIRVRERSTDRWQFIEAWWTPHLACSFLDLERSRCEECKRTQDEDHYDCRKFLEIDRRFQKSTRSVLGALALLVLGALGGIWLVRVRRAKGTFGVWAEGARRHLRDLGLESGPQYSKWLMPSRFAWFKVTVPSQRGWERWGKNAIVLRPKDAGVLDRDVNLAAALAVRSGANLAMIVHEDTSAPDLSAVRAALEWSAREGGKAVHVLMLSWSRFTWAKNSQDLLDMTMSASLRANPFELRGRVTSSAQFFNRERLVSGLLGGVQAGRFHVITGLRRSGKSSLALEVARRLPGPSAYVDLAGFHQEIQADTGAGQAADAILRYTCGQLLESARRFRQVPLHLEVPSTELDALTLSTWFRTFFDQLGEQQDAESAAVLLVFDEIEQGIGAARDLPHALDVLAILLGRLRSALQGTSLGSNDRVGVLFASALHPLLWSPLATLAGQSIVGSFEYVFVPCLPREASLSMMQSLGAWHGIRFTEEAASAVVEESQGVPLLARRLGTAVLELYDPDRARQGTLGAVNIGLEAVRAAVEREVTEGSPARVWIESEIAHRKSPGGAVLRYLAFRDWVPARELRRVATQFFQQEFVLTGIAATLDEHEVLRRAEEAGGVTVRMLGESGLLQASGDPTEPDTYRLPEGMLRTVLGSAGKDA